MSFSRTTALVRAKGFGDLPARIERLAGERTAVDVFEKEALPIVLWETPETPMPLRSMVSLFARAAGTLGWRTLGLEVGEQMACNAYGRWLEYSFGAPTLGEAIERACSTSWAHLRGPRLELVPSGEYSILKFVTPSLDVDTIQYADHILPTMLSFVRLYLGRQWRPYWAEVNYARDPSAKLVEDRLQIALRCEATATGIPVRTSDLNRRRDINPVSAVNIVTLRDVWADVILADAPKPARAVSAIVTLRLLDGKSDIEGAAKLIGLGVQGLQRRLREKGYTYREIVDYARRARAIRLLVETHMSISAIGYSLGYEDHATFTRAFIRWMGCAPSEYRNVSRRLAT